MIVMTISLMASAAAVQAPASSEPAPAPSSAAATAPAQLPATSAPAPAGNGAAAVQAEGAGNQDAYEQMVAAAEVARRGELPVDDSPDHVHRMAGSDRNKERYFNRPGATEAQYQFEWTGCRQIARRLASPSGNLVWMQAGFTQGGLVGGLLFGGLDAAFSQLRARRDIRRRCMVARGWRLVEPDEAGRARIDAMSRPDREAYFSHMLGAAEVEPGAQVTDLASLQRATTAAKPNRDSESDPQ